MNSKLLQHSKVHIFLLTFLFLFLFLSLSFGQTRPPIATYSDVYCEGSPIVVSASSPTFGSSIEWYIYSDIRSHSPFATSKDGADLILDNKIPLPVGTTKIYAVAISNGNRSEGVEVPINVRSAAVVLGIGSDKCMLYRGDNVNLFPILSVDKAEYTYEWRKTQNKLLDTIASPSIISTEKIFSKASLQEADAGIYELTVWNENKTCATVSTIHLVIRDVCMPSYPIENLGLDLSQGRTYVYIKPGRGRYYISTDESGVFNFRLEERYRNKDLDVTVFVEDGCQVGKTTLRQSIGTSWYSLNFNPICTPNKKYLMKMTSSTGDMYEVPIKFNISELKNRIYINSDSYCPNLEIYLSSSNDGGVVNSSMTWYKTTTNSKTDLPNESTDWEVMKVYKSKKTMIGGSYLTYSSSEEKVQWLKTLVIDGRGCVVESEPVFIEKENGNENLFRIPNTRNLLPKAEFVSTDQESSLLKGIEVKLSGFSINSYDRTPVVISILNADGTNSSPSSVIKSFEMEASEFSSLFILNNDDIFIFDEPLRVPRQFYISINANSNSIYMSARCNIAQNRAWERKLDGSWIPLSAPISSGGLEFATSYVVNPIFHTKPKTNFVASFDLAYQYEEVTFFDISEADPETYDWTFAGASTSTDSIANPTATYSQKGEYDVSLKTSNISGTDSLSKPNYIKVLENYSIRKNTYTQLYAKERDQEYEDGQQKYKAKGEYFISNEEDDYLQGVEIKLSYLRVPSYGNWERTLPIYLMSVDSIDKKPYQIIDSMSVPFDYIEKAIEKQGFIRFKWKEAIALPSEFFIVVDIKYATDLKYAIPYGKPNEEMKQGTAWIQLKDGTWQRQEVVYTFTSTSHAIYPITTRYKILSSEENNIFSYSIELFPNPASDFIEIKSSEISLNEYSIVNILGATIKQGHLLEQNTIDISKFNKGLYFIRFMTNKGIITKRFIVK
ncbi:T9SS type A sorting domain-containing protein [Bernardetia sp. Wsw4-3y2]|uniref:T9SS type A sorting domain-containing protein n=1 Tax=Bernardetia sp. Wsw4-3y2 TaxID=3127471 RepID=UPI0030CC1DD9